MDPLTFMQLADTQFGMFQNFIEISPERMADYRSRGLSVRPVEPFEGLRRRKQSVSRRRWTQPTRSSRPSWQFAETW